MDEKELKGLQKDKEEMLDKIRSGEMLVNKSFPANGTASEKMKYKICQNICHIFNNTGKDYQKLAKAMGCEIIQVKQMAHSHYDAFTLDLLVDSYDKLCKSDFVPQTLIRDVG